MKTERLNTGRDWQELQETNDGFIVLDSNDLIVSCNDKAQELLAHSWLQSEQSTPNVLPVNCFWLDIEQRPYHVSEFKNMAGRSVQLLFMPSYCDAYKVKVQVEAFQLLGQQYYSLVIWASLLIQDDHVDADVSHLRPLSKMAQVLREDLRQNKLELYYQPQINVANNSLYGVEALARWTSDEFGRVAPDDFIALAEEFGLIAELDLWVFREACRQLASWRKNGMQVPRVAVNFSPFSFSSNLVKIVQATLQQHGLMPSDLVLEITESHKIQVPDSFIKVIEDLHSMGVTISLDDFGTGYSNLKRLLKFPVSQLKLDRIFVSKLPNKLSEELSDVVFSIGKKIGAVSIAEGVETLQQLTYLRAIGYEVVQGYLFSPPLPILSFESWISNENYLI